MRGDDRRAPLTPEPATSHHLNDTTQRRSQTTPLAPRDNSDALFAASVGVYDTSYVLPGEDPASGAARRDVGQGRTVRVADKGEVYRFEETVATMPPEVDFTAEDVRERLGDTIIEPNQHGALLQGLARRGKIRKTGYTTATRPSAHARVIATWRVVA